MMNSQMKRFVLVLTVCVFAQATFAQTAKKRDPLKYDDGGVVDFNWGRHCEFEFLAERLRDFVWRHFHEHHLGVIEQRAYSIEGDPGYSKIFIEPDEKGVWQIVVEARYECCWFYGMQKPRKKRETTYDYFILKSVERVEAKYWQCGREPTSTGKAIAADAVILPGAYQLVLKADPSGKVARVF